MKATENYLRNRWQSLSVLYINRGYLGRWDRLLSLARPALPFQLNAKRVSSAFVHYRDSRGTPTGTPHRVSIRPLRQKNPNLEALKERLVTELADDLYGAYIHGSLADGEQTAYSDVDALVVVRDAAIIDPRRLARVGFTLNKCLKYFYRIDPLQHHGWFVIAESALADYPLTYFPRELLHYSRSLLSTAEQHMEIRINPEREDFSRPFITLARYLLGQLRSGRVPGNLYALKSLLSTFFLLPALYLQARDQKAVYKKFSFEAAAKDFSPDLWRIMDEASAIRRDWNYPLPAWRRKLLEITAPAIRKIVVTYLAPPLPRALKIRLGGDFLSRMGALCRGMMEQHDKF